MEIREVFNSRRDTQKIAEELIRESNGHLERIEADKDTRTRLAIIY